MDDRRAVQYARSLGFRVAPTLSIYIRAKRAERSGMCGKRPIGFAQRAFGCPNRITGQFWRRRAKCEVAGRVSRAVFITLKNGAQMRTVVDTNLRPWRNQFIPGPLNADFFNVRSPDVEEFG